MAHCTLSPSVVMKEVKWVFAGQSMSSGSTDDMAFTVETVSCLGACGLSPVVMVNDTVHPAMTPDKAVDLIEELRAKEGA